MEQKSGYKYYNDETITASRVKVNTFMPVKAGDLNVYIKENPSYDKQNKVPYKLDYVPQPSSANRELNNPLEIDGVYKSHFNLGMHNDQLYVNPKPTNLASLLVALAGKGNLETLDNDVDQNTGYYKEVKEMRTQALLSRLQPRTYDF